MSKPLAVCTGYTEEEAFKRSVAADLHELPPNSWGAFSRRALPPRCTSSPMQIATARPGGLVLHLDGAQPGQSMKEFYAFSPAPTNRAAICGRTPCVNSALPASVPLTGSVSATHSHGKDSRPPMCK